MFCAVETRLCSDGLSHLVEDAHLSNAVERNDLDVAGDTLVVLARGRGGHDNISVVIADVLPLGTFEDVEEIEEQVFFGKRAR